MFYGNVLSSNRYRYLFSSRHFDIISDSWYNSVFCDGWVNIATFSSTSTLPFPPSLSLPHPFPLTDSVYL